MHGRFRMATIGVAVLVMSMGGLADRLVARHAELTLDRAPRRGVLGVELHMLRVFLRHRGDRVVRVEIGVRVGLDLADDALQLIAIAC